MEKIGYVYKYSSSEKKGILVCGNWTDSCITSDDMAILFSDEDLLSEVCEGQLVYFDIEDGKKVSKIERASLAKFKSDIINDIISCKAWGDERSFYKRNTIISFENLEDKLESNEEENDDLDEFDLWDFMIDSFSSGYSYNGKVKLVMSCSVENEMSSIHESEINNSGTDDDDIDFLLF